MSTHPYNVTELREMASDAKDLRRELLKLAESIQKKGPIELYKHIVRADASLAEIQHGLLSEADRAAKGGRS